MPPPVNVFICDDVPELRRLIRCELEADPALRVVGEAADGAGGIAGVMQTAPDAILLDLSMPGMDGLEALPIIRKAAPDAALLVYTGFAEERLGEVSLARGADRYLQKDQPAEAVRQAVLEAVAERRANGAAR
jgi:DNA-binding NarL/FixJ family response regulator